MRKQTMGLLVICVLVVIFSLLGLVSDFTTGLLASGIDGLMFALVCLVLIAVFGLVGLVMAKRAGLLPGGKSAPAAPAK
jgi:hypothetical protein